MEVLAPEQVLDIPLDTIRGFHNHLIATFVLGCDIVHDNDHQMAYPILQFFYFLFDGRYVLIINHELIYITTFPGQNLTNLAYFNNLDRNSNCLLQHRNWYDSSCRLQQCQNFFPAGSDVLCHCWNDLPGVFRRFLTAERQLLNAAICQGLCAT